MKALQMTRVLISQKMEKVFHRMTTEIQMIQMDMVIIQKMTVIIRGMILRDIDSISQPKFIPDCLQQWDSRACGNSNIFTGIAEKE